MKNFCSRSGKKEGEKLRRVKARRATVRVRNLIFFSWELKGLQVAAAVPTWQSSK